MCGIAGIVGSHDNHAAVAAVEAMCSDLARRGPDAKGTASWGDVVFGHRRLAIFDLSDAGRQPMMTPDKRVGVVFNGAIYNHRELRNSLFAYQFVSRTDTEVLLHGYLKWGIDGLVQRLRGMFAFALWDDAQRKLYMVRDRLGVKPLVYAVKHGALAFASTVRALANAGYGNDLDPDAILGFLDNGFLADGLSIYRGVTKVPAATIIEVSLASAVRPESITCRPYWAPPSPAAGITFETAVTTAREMLLDAVKVRLHADVPIGALLSGGIDSSLVCWGVQQLGADVQAYTVSTPGDPWDETAAAKVTAERLGIKHQVVAISDQDLPEIDDLISAYGEPLGCASALGMLRVCRAISEYSGVKVLLTGDGGDDVFLGYPRHRNLWLASCLASFSPPVTAAWRVLHARVPRIGPMRRGAALLDYAAWGLDGYLHNVERHKIGSDQRVFSEHVEAATGRGCSALADFLHYELKTRFVGEYLTKVDGATMHHGIEARSPFLDQLLWEFASSLPFDVRLHHGRLKAVLRRLVHREIDPRVSRRPKRGFGVPVQRWLSGRWRAWVEALFHDSLLEKEGWLRVDIASLMSRSTKEGAAPAYVWHAAVLESWLRHARRA